LRLTDKPFDGIVDGFLQDLFEAHEIPSPLRFNAF
jgi:hypothetical protein